MLAKTIKPSGITRLELLLLLVMALVLAGVVISFIGGQREFCRQWPNQREVTVKGVHFIQEDSPHEIGRALADWYRSI